MNDLTKQIIDLDEKYYINTYGKRTPVVFTHGDKMFLWSPEGNMYMDLLGGIAVNVLGHNNKALVETICNQASNLIHCSNLYYVKSQAELAKELVDIAPGMKKVFFTNSGAESNEAAIKLARIHYQKKGNARPKIISALNSFHGRTLATVTATGQEKYNKPFAPLPAGFVYVPFNDIDAIKNEIDDTTCAVILELIQGEGGVIPAQSDYIKKVSDYCKEHDTCLIIDEVQTGIGRTGTFFAYEQYGITPDIVTLAKGLGGGVPIGAMIVGEKVQNSFSPGDHGSTFGGNPLACSSALCVLTEIKKNSLLDNANKMGVYLVQKLDQLGNKTSRISEVRGKGLMVGIILDLEIAPQVKNKLFENGFLVNSIGSNIIRILPPLIISKNDIDSFVNTLEKVLSEF